jgi:rfaE bifunctional protein kinase chain/domain
MEDFKKLFDSFTKLKVGVIGDVMLDTYMWGGVERISPEAPVPVVSLHKKDYRIGGAGNVALNAQSLGAQTFVLSVIGDDEDGEKLEQMFSSNTIYTNYIIRSRERITTNKTRIISRNQQMMRLDAEITKQEAIAKETHDAIEAMRDPKTIERIARDKLGYAKAGETVIRFEPGTNSTVH